MSFSPNLYYLAIINMAVNGILRLIADSQHTGTMPAFSQSRNFRAEIDIKIADTKQVPHSCIYPLRVASLTSSALDRFHS
jgi:hypothetical protein